MIGGVGWTGVLGGRGTLTWGWCWRRWSCRWAGTLCAPWIWWPAPSPRTLSLSGSHIGSAASAPSSATAGKSHREGLQASRLTHTHTQGGVTGLASHTHTHTHTHRPLSHKHTRRGYRPHVSHTHTHTNKQRGVTGLKSHTHTHTHAHTGHNFIFYEKIFLAFYFSFTKNGVNRTENIKIKKNWWKSDYKNANFRDISFILILNLVLSFTQRLC